MYILYNSALRNTDREVEGVGSIYLRIISLIAFCRDNNIEFIHFKHHIGHNYNNIEDDKYDTMWDEFFNIGSICKRLNNDDYNNFEIIRKHELEENEVDELLKNKDKDKLYYFTLIFPIIYKKPDYYFKLIEDDILEAYKKNNSNRQLKFDKNKKNIAIHIRVWNEMDGTNYSDFLNSICGRHLINENTYINILNRLVNKYVDYDIHIFSQSCFKLKYSNIYNSNKFHCHLDMDTKDTIHHFINADVLLLGFSCLSFLAGIYNKNTVIYPNYPYLPKMLDRWISINEI
jgi:hypothetical protein